MSRGKTAQSEPGSSFLGCNQINAWGNIEQSCSMYFGCFLVVPLDVALPNTFLTQLNVKSNGLMRFQKLILAIILRVWC